MFDFIDTIIASIFNGTLIFVPCIWLFFKFYNSARNKLTLINTINCTLLIGSTFFILYTVATIIVDFSPGAEDGRYMPTNRFFGPYWWAFWLVIAPGYLLPQLFWFRKFRNSIISSVVIVGIATGLSLFVKSASTQGHFKFTAFEYLIQATIYIIIVSGVYFLLCKKRISQPSHS